MSARENVAGDRSKRLLSLRAMLHLMATVAGLAAILVAGATLRYLNTDWDDGHHLHPDERFITMVGTAIELPTSLAEYFDTSASPLNPYNRGFGSFVYGTYPLFLVRALAEPLQAEGYDRIHLLGRVASATHDLATVVLVFAIGAFLYGRRIGLLAACLSAFTVLQIQHAHFFTVDSFLTCYLAMAFYALLRGLASGRPLWYGLAGLALGLAIATKINALLFLALPATAAAADWFSRREAGTERPGWPPWLGATALGLIALVVFRLAQPYAFSGPGLFNVALNPTWLGDLAQWQRLASGEIDYPPSHQWAGTTPYLFPLRHMVLWGLGLPLGLAAWAGVVLAALQLVRRWHAHQHHLLVLLWIGLNFWYWGQQMGKTMRYFLPIYPFLAILAAYGLVSFVSWAGARTHTARPARRVLRGLSLAVLVLVPLTTALYAIAFSTIYTRPVTRVAASEWIYTHLPPGSAFAWEHWDDPLPLRLPGYPAVEECTRPNRNPQALCSYQLTLYDEDTPEKRERLLAILDQVDYIFLSSNRLYGSIPRLPMRYPLTTEYYRLLFNGQLGFDLVATFTSYPQLFGVTLNDDTAEEAFTVYDHPKVLIFQKSPDYSAERVRQLLGAVDLGNVIRLRPTQVAQGALHLTPEERAAHEHGGTWREIFDRASLANQMPVAAWLLAVETLAMVVLPLLWQVLPGLADRGFFLAKLLGLLATGYLAWLLASLRLLEFSRASIVAAMLVLATLSALVLRRRTLAFWAFLRGRWRLLVLEEVLFLLAFAAFVQVRLANPDLWHATFGGEKPMDFAYLNAVIKSSFFPPYDPWFAGGYINYYYFGFVLTATLVKLTGIVPWVAYNLAIPYYFAVTVGAAFSFGHTLFTGYRRRYWPDRVAVGVGLLAASLVAVVGNLDALVQVSESLGRMGGLGFQSRLPGLAGLVNALFGLRALLVGQPLPPLDFWRSTRVIGPEDPGPITEFPYFTFLYGDLHAHLIGLPVTIAVIAVGLNVIRLAQARELLPSSWMASDRARLGQLARSAWPWSVAVVAWLVGMLRTINTWDYPTYLALAAAAFTLAHVTLWRRASRAAVAWSLAALAGLVGLSSALFLPYLQRYALFYTGLEPVRQTTVLSQYLILFGGFLVLVGGLLVVESWRVWRRAARSLSVQVMVAAPRFHAGSPAPAWLESLELAAWPAVALALIAVALSLTGRQSAALATVGLALVAFHLLRPGLLTQTRYLLLMAGLGLALTVVPELFAIEGDIGRMNTVFKFSLQAWVLLALVGAAAVPSTARYLRRLGGADSSLLWLWRLAVVAIVGAGLLYPLLASREKLRLRFVNTPPTLDGMAFMEQAVYQDQGRPIRLGADFAAINWLLDHVDGSPTIVEAVTPLYRWGSRVSVYTGLPTVLGWDWHQKQQRGDFAWMVDQRARDVQEFFETPSPEVARQFLRQYDVRYIYVGPVERAYYSSAGLAKFEQMVGTTLEIVYRTPEVTIYRVTGSP